MLLRKSWQPCLCAVGCFACALTAPDGYRIDSHNTGFTLYGKAFPYAMVAFRCEWTFCWLDNVAKRDGKGKRQVMNKRLAHVRVQRHCTGLCFCAKVLRHRRLGHCSAPKDCLTLCAEGLPRPIVVATWISVRMQKRRELLIIVNPHEMFLSFLRGIFDRFWRFVIAK